MDNSIIKIKDFLDKHLHIKERVFEILSMLAKYSDYELNYSKYTKFEITNTAPNTQLTEIKKFKYSLTCELIDFIPEFKPLLTKYLQAAETERGTRLFNKELERNKDFALKLISTLQQERMDEIEKQDYIQKNTEQNES